MTSNPASMVQPLQQEFHNLLAYVAGTDARSQTASTVELTLFRRLLALGAALLRLFCVTRAAGRPAEPVTASDGTPLRDHDQRPTTSYAVFGNVCFVRHDFTAPGHIGRCPLDAERSLPAPCSRRVKKLMQLRACSISGVPQAVRDIELGLGGLYLG